MRVSDVTFLSPVLRYDALAQVVVFERRNPDTGDVTFQIPDRAALREAQASIGQANPAPTIPELPPASITAESILAAVPAPTEQAASPAKDDAGTPARISLLI